MAAKEKLSLLITVQNIPIKTDYIKAKINYTQQIGKWRLCGDTNETIEKFKFDQTTKLYMLNQEYILENKTHKILRDFELKTN